MLEKRGHLLPVWQCSGLLKKLWSDFVEIFQRGGISLLDFGGDLDDDFRVFQFILCCKASYKVINKLWSTVAYLLFAQQEYNRK